MRETGKVDSKEIGLEIGLLIGRFFFKTDDLHYGYWPDGLEIDVTNLARAQEYHSRFIISHIPAGTETILDVGAGAGDFARELLQEGYEVDCVSPSSFLSRQLQEKLGDACHLYTCKYEDLKTDKRYDLILFSESFQYVNAKKALRQSVVLLREAGHILICDFFRTDAKGRNPLPGGPRFSTFLNVIADYPVETIKDIDITKETAPTIEILDNFLREVARPVSNLSAEYLRDNYPRLMKLLRWKYRKRFNKLDTRYLSGKMSAEAYLKHKTYRLLLYRKTSSHIPS